MWINCHMRSKTNSTQRKTDQKTALNWSLRLLEWSLLLSVFMAAKFWPRNKQFANCNPTKNVKRIVIWRKKGMYNFQLWRRRCRLAVSHFTVIKINFCAQTWNQNVLNLSPISIRKSKNEKAFSTCLVKLDILWAARGLTACLQPN